jgi:hypothetical protein
MDTDGAGVSGDVDEPRQLDGRDLVHHRSGRIMEERGGLMIGGAGRQSNTGGVIGTDLKGYRSVLTGTERGSGRDGCGVDFGV